MSDLSAFFAKKNDKKKKNAVKLDDVGQILERRAKKQEEHDQQADEDDKRNGMEEEKRPMGEDSEWIEYGDSNTGRLEGLKIKDMGAESELPEEEQHDVEEQKEQHETRTWGQVDVKEEKDVSTAADMAAYQRAANAPRKFVPSALRERRVDAGIDMSSQEMFPSLADASKMETAKKEDAKTGGGWVKSGQSENRPAAGFGGARGWGAAPSGPPSSGRDREGALAAAKTVLKALAAQNAAAAPPPMRQPVVEEVKKPSANAYVPPHLRNRN